MDETFAVESVFLIPRSTVYIVRYRLIPDKIFFEEQLNDWTTVARMVICTIWAQSVHFILAPLLFSLNSKCINIFRQTVVSFQIFFSFVPLNIMLLYIFYLLEYFYLFPRIRSQLQSMTSPCGDGSFTCTWSGSKSYLCEMYKYSRYAMELAHLTCHIKARKWRSIHYINPNFSENNLNMQINSNLSTFVNLVVHVILRSIFFE